MTTSQRRVLELALLGLESERRRIADELADIRQRLGHARSEPRPQSVFAQSNAPAKGTSSLKRKKMTVAQRKKISQAMKARWAAVKRTKVA